MHVAKRGEDECGPSDGKARHRDDRSRLRSIAERWIPESWAQARVDPGRVGWISLSLLGLVVLAVVLLTVWADRPSAEPVPRLPAVLPPPPAEPRVEPERLVVSVVGRVTRPGLVTLDSDSRVADALRAVGGALPSTDITTLNLARKLVDGEQLYVAVPIPPGISNSAPRAGPAGDDDRVDLNTATKEEFGALPGVGEVTADRLVQWREEHGRFASVDQLQEVGGIGESRLSRLRDRVRA